MKMRSRSLVLSHVIESSAMEHDFNGILCFNKNVRIVYTYTPDSHINSFYTSYKYIAAYV